MNGSPHILGRAGGDGGGGKPGRPAASECGCPLIPPLPTPDGMLLPAWGQELNEPGGGVFPKTSGEPGGLLSQERSLCSVGI